MRFGDWVTSLLGFKVGFGTAERTIVDANGSVTPKDVTTSETYTGAGSYQGVAADLTLASAAGTSAAGDTAFLGAVMGHVMGENAAKTNNYVGGVIGAYGVTGTQASTYPTGGVLGHIDDGVTVADGAVVGYIDGDSAVTRANAAFKARMRNSTAGSGFDYGVDLYDPAEGAYNELSFAKADLRLSKEVCVLSGDSAPVNGTTGKDVAGPGSLYIDYTNAEAYINANTKASPTWKKITRAA